MSHAAPIQLPLPEALPASFVRPQARPPRPGRAAPFRFIPARPEPAWRQALRWMLAGLAASCAAGEASLLLLGLR